MCMCGSHDCHSCGPAQGAPSSCYNCGKNHKIGSKRGEKCIQYIRKADNAYAEALIEEDRLAKEYFNNPE